MIKTDYIISKIEKYASLDLAENWDNSGWQIDLGHDYTNKLLVALSFTKCVFYPAVRIFGAVPAGKAGSGTGKPAKFGCTAASPAACLLGLPGGLREQRFRLYPASVSAAHPSAVPCRCRLLLSEQRLEGRPCLCADRLL